MTELRGEKDTKRDSSALKDIQLDRHESAGHDHQWTERERVARPFRHRARSAPNQLTCIECTVGLNEEKRESIKRGEYNTRFKSM